MSSRCKAVLMAISLLFVPVFQIFKLFSVMMFLSYVFSVSGFLGHFLETDTYH